MSEKKIDQKQLNTLVREEMQKFLEENREVIVKRAEKRLRQLRKNDEQKTVS